MPTTSMLKSNGLHTYNNNLSEVPEGALQEANNVNIDRLSTIECRRGITQYGSIGLLNADTAKQLLTYKKRVLAHYNDKIAFDNGSGLFTDFLATFSETENGLRVKFIEQNGNLYITTSTGIRKICASSSAALSSAVISNAGGIKAIGGTAAPNYDNDGFLEGYSKVAYRIVWGTKDANSNLILGSPSMPIEVTNQSVESCTVDVTFGVPFGITTDYFYRIYRTAVFTAASFIDIQNLIVNDEYNLVYEDAYTSGTNITVNDIVPEDFREGGTPLYTNASSGEGILQANEAPPFAKDVGQYKNSAFFANTRTKHRLLIDMIGVTNLQKFGAIGDSIDITNITYTSPNTTIQFSANHGLVAGQKIVITNSGSIALDGTKTIDSVTPTTIVIITNGTGASATNISIYSSSISISKGISTRQYFFVGRPDINTITFPSYYAGIDQKYFIISSANNQTEYVVFFNKQGDPVIKPSNSETVGKVYIQVTVDVSDTATIVATKVKTAIEAASYDFSIEQLTDTLTFTCVESGPTDNPNITTLAPVAGISTTNLQDGDGEDVANGYIMLSSLPSPSQRIDVTARSLSNIISFDISSDVVVYYISGPNDAPGKLNIESKTLDTTVFSIIASDSSTGSSFNPNITTATSSTNEEKSNRVYYSKTNQPEAVPIVNYFDVGPQDTQILRIIGLRDSMFVLKEEGLYRITGEGPSSFSLTLFDNSVNIVAPDTCTVMDNQIFGLSSQGVVRISETGVDIISQPVQDAFNLYTSPRYVNYKTASFAASYIQDYAYIIWLPKNETDTTGTIAYRFSTKTKTWTTWTKTGNARCAIVNTENNRLYVGPDDDNIIEIERKDLKRRDFADRQYTLSIGNNSIMNNIIQLNTVDNITVGDALIQSQYVTAAVIERLAKKFALDAGVPNNISNDNKNYYRNFNVIPGDNLQDRLAELIAQLNADVSGSFNTIYSTDITTFKNEYNTLVNTLNVSIELLHTNYLPVSTLIEFELLITSVNKNNNSVTVGIMQPLGVGNIVHYKAVNCQVTFNPYFFGDPSTLKQVRESTIMFSNATLATGVLAFNTDLSASFEEISYNMEGTGNWGASVFGNTTWGGEGTSRPFRTLIPKQKQRCRFIRSRFKHIAAFDEFRILGISYTFEVSSSRAYK